MKNNRRYLDEDRNEKLPVRKVFVCICLFLLVHCVRYRYVVAVSRSCIVSVSANVGMYKMRKCEMTVVIFYQRVPYSQRY